MLGNECVNMGQQPVVHRVGEQQRLVGLFALEGVVAASVFHTIWTNLLRYWLGWHPCLAVVIIPSELVGVAWKFVFRHHLKRVGNAVIVTILALFGSLGGVGGELQVKTEVDVYLRWPAAQPVIARLADTPQPVHDAVFGVIGDQRVTQCGDAVERAANRAYRVDICTASLSPHKHAAHQGDISLAVSGLMDVDALLVRTEAKHRLRLLKHRQCPVSVVGEIHCTHQTALFHVKVGTSANNPFKRIFLYSHIFLMH